MARTKNAREDSSLIMVIRLASLYTEDGGLGPKGCLGSLVFSGMGRRILSQRVGDARTIRAAGAKMPQIKKKTAGGFPPAPHS